MPGLDLTVILVILEHYHTTVDNNSTLVDKQIRQIDRQIDGQIDEYRCWGANTTFKPRTTGGTLLLVNSTEYLRKIIRKKYFFNLYYLDLLTIVFLVIIYQHAIIFTAVVDTG